MDHIQEHNISLWVGTSAESDYPRLQEDLNVDVVVVGAGITGLSTAIQLKNAGATVAVVEARQVASSTTGYTTAKVTSLHGVMYADLVERAGKEQAQQYADANEAGLREVAKHVETLGIDCDFRHANAFSYSTENDQADRMYSEAEAAQSLGLPASVTTDTELPYEVAAAVQFTNQAMFHPRKYCLGLAATIMGDGSYIFENTRVTGVECNGTCEVRTDHGTIRAAHVVLATQLPILDTGAFFARTHPARSYAMAAKLNTAALEHMYLGIDTLTRSIRSHSDGANEWVIFGGEGHKVGQDPDTEDRYQALEKWARKHWDVRSIDYRWAAEDFMPVDDVPYIGPITRGNPRILVATGFRKWGMTTGAAAGLILTDAIVGRTSPWAEVFDSTRIDIRRSARQFVVENTNVAKRLIGDRLRTIRKPDAADLGKNEGGIVDLQGEKVAAYRDETGRLHAVSPICTHLGCQVTWNTAERSWDCPCHGSRFTIDGDVLQGPAVKPLTPHGSS